MFRIKILLLALAVLLVGSGCKFFSKESKPNVIFLMLDTTRADNLGIYGYERNTSPNLDAFAKESWLFKHAITAAPWTPPSVAGMLSGLYPASHSFMPPNSREQAKANVSQLSQSVLTLPEILKAQGYQTYGVSPNPWITKEFGFAQGFDAFEYHPRAQAEALTKVGIRAIEQMTQKDEPFFLYLHYLDPHETYDPPARYAKMFSGPLKRHDYSEEMQRKLGLYDGEIAYMDQWLGALFKFLKDKGLYDDAIIVVVGDHGEQFMEHGEISHGNQLVNPELHVPLIIRTGKGAAPRVIDYAVSNIDVFPTILELVGLHAPAGYQSISLLKDENSSTRPGVISEISRKYVQRAFTAFSGERLLLGSKDKDPADKSEEIYNNIVGLFDSFVDYWETKNVTEPARVEELRLELQNEFARAAKLKVKSVTGGGIADETIKQLESLGYLK
jgi:arylsulfatase A-like enzyme